MIWATVESPFGKVTFEGNERFGRRVTFSTRYKLVADPLEFFRATSFTPVDTSQRMYLNERLRKPILLLPKPDKVV